MTVYKYQLFQYRLPLLESFPRNLSKNLWAQGLIVALHSEDGYIGFGEVTEASLLAGETLGLAQTQLLAALCDDAADVAQFMAPVQWALSSAKLNLELACSQRDFATFMGKPCRSSVSLNVLLDASRSDFVQRGLNYDAQGFRVFKIKVGEADVGLEISRIHELMRIIGNKSVIRLDGNRNMTLANAVEMARSLKKVSIEYFEEPFENRESIDEFYKVTGVKIALDETVLTDEFLRWQNHEAVSTYVLKPSRIGDIKKVKNLMKLAFDLEKSFVISSTFESGIGLANLAQFASLSQNQNIAMGLATGAYFSSDFLQPPLRAFRGQLNLECISRSIQQVKLETSEFCKIIG